ncbi:MAG: hypothetical protein H0W61_15615, partial [Bacteroidetes bacterium]|nr:hypothetical protein [Bacteroidota bacterium]
STELQNGWNGTYHKNGNTICQDDVYAWKIKLFTVYGENKEFLGHVTLMK